jgi:carboxynorspermidine decarboxylase
MACERIRLALVLNLDIIKDIKTPAYVLDEALLENNLKTLAEIKAKTGCKILLALKAFSMYSTFSLVKEYLDGVAASSVNEARLGYEEFGKDVHMCAPAYKEQDMADIIEYSDHIIFNSFSQWQKHKAEVQSSGRGIVCGLRINPEKSMAPAAIYDPCASGSRFGIRFCDMQADLEGISGLHFHTLCEQNADALEATLEAVEEKFGKYLKNMKWVNFGGGHHITRLDYDIEKLCLLINNFKSKYNVAVILEPGEAVALNVGYLVTSVVDVIKNDINIAVLDASAATHMPDVLEMPYRPNVVDAGNPNEKKYTYRFAGNTCLAGDIVGEYSFDYELKIGDKLVFEDMAHYTMVKNNTFNGVGLPDILVYSRKKELKVVKEFGYLDFKQRV